MWTNVHPIEESTQKRNFETIQIENRDKDQLERRIRTESQRGWTVQSRLHTSEGSHMAILIREPKPHPIPEKNAKT